jgi:predicted TPR repeat methyltransferase
MGKYHEYYDILNLQKKDYEGEVAQIANTFGEISPIPINKALEIGCGTGNHTIHLCGIASEVVACDIDPEMVKIASEKLTDHNAVVCNSIFDVKERDFQLCVMMWHVLNYFRDIKTITDVFSGVLGRLARGGIFMFDMWNGVAVIRDLPRTSKNTIVHQDLRIEHKLEGRTFLLEQRTEITNHIEVYRGIELIDDFVEKVDHFFWTANTIVNLLSDFTKVRLVKTSDHKTPADADDWKIMVIAEK